MWWCGVEWDLKVNASWERETGASGWVGEWTSEWETEWMSSKCYGCPLELTRDPQGEGLSCTCTHITAHHQTTHDIDKWPSHCQPTKKKLPPPYILRSHPISYFSSRLPKHLSSPFSSNQDYSNTCPLPSLLIKTIQTPVLSLLG